MGEFAVYILKSAVCISVFYLFYRLLLSRETFHRFNRYAMLGILLLSLLIPFCEITIKQHGEIQQTVLSIEQLLLLADAAAEQTSATYVAKEKTNGIQIALLIYVAGVAFFFIRHIYSLMRLCLLLKKSKREILENGVILILHNRNHLSPFSWMRYIAISEKDMEENGREILIHELAHIRNRHSIDLLIADVYIFFQWFNPAAWLLKQEMQNIHEYEADEAVIEQGIDAKTYQLLIIRKTVGIRLYSMANGFNHSKLKKRITMMLKEKSSPWTKLKYLYVLPLAAIAVSAFARPEIYNELKEISEVKVNDLTAMVAVNTNENSEIIYLATDSNQVKEKKQENVQLKVTNVLTPVPYPDETVIVASKIPLIIVDGKEISQDEMSALSPNSIKSITVLKDKLAIELYGEKAVDGVIVIELLTDEELAKKPNQPKKIIISSTQRQLSDSALVILNGVEVSRLNDINPDSIVTIRGYKSDDMTNESSTSVTVVRGNNGEKAEYSVMNISSKKSAPLNGRVVQISGIKNSTGTMQVEGLVVDREREPVIGAIILITGTTSGTVSDAEGKFKLKCDEGDTLTVAYVGMKSALVQPAANVTVTMEKE